MKKELETRRVRVLPLDRKMVEMLRDYIGRGGPIRHNGNPSSGSPRGREHGVSPHRLRDAFAVMAVKHDDSGDGLRLLQEHLGHVSFNTTARYRKVSGQEHQEWYEKLWEDNQAKQAEQVGGRP